MTGYAKDYIGQLCREGRVPARLVGRSWYVLESAIQDHRFGKPGAEQLEKTRPEANWESPRYESSPGEELPSLNELKEAQEPTEEASGVPQHLRDSWKAWFDHVAQAALQPAEEVKEAVKVEDTIPAVQEREEIEPEAIEEVIVPIHALHRASEEPVAVDERLDYRAEEPRYVSKAQKTRPGGIVTVIRVMATLIMVIAIGTAVVGSGYFDKYIVSVKPVRLMAGVSLYNK